LRIAVSVPPSHRRTLSDAGKEEKKKCDLATAALFLLLPEFGGNLTDCFH
jgi:hypothetical protein